RERRRLPEQRPARPPAVRLPARRRQSADRLDRGLGGAGRRDVRQAHPLRGPRRAVLTAPAPTAHSSYAFFFKPGKAMLRPAPSKTVGKFGTLVWPPSCCRQASSPPMSVFTFGIGSVR